MLHRGVIQKLFKMLLDAEANVDICAERGGTALVCAAQQGHMEIVKMLLDAKADVDIFGEKDGTALVCGAQQGQIAVNSYNYEIQIISHSGAISSSSSFLELFLKAI